jgi:hypothetical protein
VVTGHLLALKYATVLSLRFTVCLLYQRLSSELLIMHPTVHLACHTPLNSMHAFEHDEQCRQCLHGAEERRSSRFVALMFNYGYDLISAHSSRILSNAEARCLMGDPALMRIRSKAQSSEKLLFPSLTSVLSKMMMFRRFGTGRAPL